MSHNKKTISGFLRQFRDFGRPAQLFLVVTMIQGVVVSMWMLFFNFYILQLGFDRQFLGLVNSVTAVATLVFGIPMGLYSDRIGRKKAMLIGLGIYITASILELLVTDRYLLLSMAFFSGVGGTLYFLNVAPFLMKVSKSGNRTFLFSFNFGLSILAGVAGNLFASQFSSFFAGILQVPPSSTMAYRATLLSAISISCLSIVLLGLIREPGFEYLKTDSNQSKAERQLKTIFASFKGTITQSTVLKLAFVQVVFGFGVSILFPYINLFFNEKYLVSDQTLGVIFSLKALLTGLGAMIVPRLVRTINSRIKVVVFSQLLGGTFVLLMGFSPVLPLAVLGFLLGGGFLNTPIPLVEAFSMEQVDEDQRATLGSIREFSWQTSWSVGPYASGLLQDRTGFSPVFILTFGAICLSAVMNNLFFLKKEQQLSTTELVELS